LDYRRKVIHFNRLKENSIFNIYSPNLIFFPSGVHECSPLSQLEKTTRRNQQGHLSIQNRPVSFWRFLISGKQIFSLLGSLVAASIINKEIGEVVNKNKKNGCFMLLSEGIKYLFNAISLIFHSK